MCRAVKVLCLASDGDSLQELKRAAVGAEWELAPGATTTDEALVQLGEIKPHILVVFGPFAETVAVAEERVPWLRVIADFDAPGVDQRVGSLDEVRKAVLGSPRPGGPVRAPNS